MAGSAALRCLAAPACAKSPCKGWYNCKVPTPPLAASVPAAAMRIAWDAHRQVWPEARLDWKSLNSCWERRLRMLWEGPFLSVHDVILSSCSLGSPNIPTLTTSNSYGLRWGLQVGRQLQPNSETWNSRNRVHNAPCLHVLLGTVRNRYRK